MPQDPYGFKDAAPPPSLEGGDASRAMWAGVTSALLGTVGICFCYIPYFFALPLGLYAAWSGYKCIGAAAADGRDRTMATAGMVSGGVASLISGAFVAFWLMYLLFFVLYFVFVFVMIGVAAIAQGTG